MVSLVNEYDISITKRAFQITRESAFTLEVRVVVGNESDEAAVQVRKQALNDRSPNIFAGRFGSEQHDTFPFMHDHAFQDHEAYICLAKTNAVAKECGTIQTGDFDQVFVGILLVAGENREDDGVLAIPFIGREFVTTEQLMECLEPDLERGAWIRMALESAENLGCDVFRLGPMPLIPFLENLHVIAANLDIEFDVILKARLSEVRRAH